MKINSKELPSLNIFANQPLNAFITCLYSELELDLTLTHKPGKRLICQVLSFRSYLYYAMTMLTFTYSETSVTFFSGSDSIHLI